MLIASAMPPPSPLYSHYSVPGSATSTIEAASGRRVANFSQDIIVRAMRQLRVHLRACVHESCDHFEHKL